MSAIERRDYFGQRVVVREHRAEQRTRPNSVAYLGRIDRRPTHVDADANNDKWAARRGACLRQHSGKLGSVEQDVVWPFQVGFDAGQLTTRSKGRQRNSLSEFVGEPRNIAQQQAHQQVRSSSCFPAPVEAASASCLMRRREHRSVGRICGASSEQIGVCRAGFVDKCDVPTRRPTGWPCDFRKRFRHVASLDVGTNRPSGGNQGCRAVIM